jgi:hypothetical protein
MKSDLRKIALFLVALTTTAGAAQASELNVTVRTNEYGSHQPVADYDLDEVDESMDNREGALSHERRRPDRYYGRPVPNWHDKQAYRHGSRTEPQEWGPRVVAGPHWGGGCRVFVKERVNRWGDLVEVRTKVCR